MVEEEMGPKRMCGLGRKCFLGEGGLKEMVGPREKRRCFPRKRWVGGNDGAQGEDVP